MTQFSRSAKTVVTKAAQAKRPLSQKKMGQLIKKNLVLQNQLAKARNNASTLRTEQDYLVKENEYLRKQVARAKADHIYEVNTIKSLHEELIEKESAMETLKLQTKELDAYFSKVFQEQFDDYEKKLASVRADCEEKAKKDKDIYTREFWNGVKVAEEMLNGSQKKVDELKDLIQKLQSLPPAASPVAMPYCQICLCKYNSYQDYVPRVLECGHTLCTSCAEKICTTSSIRCPFDRLDTCFKGIGVSSLPKNFSILEMLEADYNR